MYTLLDLFAGAGGLTRGFLTTGRFRPLYAVEINNDARQSYIKNFHPGDSNAVFQDVTMVTGSDFRQKPDVIIGGPPCQDFTQLTAVRKENDRRRNELLWKHYTDLVLELRPKVFVIENVPNLLTDSEYEQRRRELQVQFRGAGYKVVWGVLTASNFGLPQSRRRSFIIGCRTGLRPYLPFPTLVTKTAWEALREFESIRPRPIPTEGQVLSCRELHVGRQTEVLSRLRGLYVLPDGNRMQIPRPITIKSWADKPQGTSDGYGRVFTLRPSGTIRCEGFKPEKGRFLHPFLNRPLTLAEMAALQTFPDNHLFVGTYSSIAHQIGNAVPPEMAHHIAQVVAELLDHERIDVVYPPNKKKAELNAPLHLAGRNTAERILKLLERHINQPVEWWQIEQAARSKNGVQYPDWATPLQELRDAGYVIIAGNGTNGMRRGQYRLDQPAPLPLTDRPAVRRLLDLVRSQRGQRCERCAEEGNDVNPTLIRQPEDGGLLMTDNVEMLCNTCRAKTLGRVTATREEKALNWIVRYRQYPPVKHALHRVLNLPETALPDGAPPEDNQPERLREITPKVVCRLCDQSGPDLRAEFIRPREAGGLYVQENLWVLCAKCRSELKNQQIKVPVLPGTTGTQERAQVVPLVSRFAERDFLTPDEARFVNWLAQYKRDPVISERARMALQEGRWE